MEEKERKQKRRKGKGSLEEGKGNEARRADK